MNHISKTGESGHDIPVIVAVCLSGGGLPKTPQTCVHVDEAGVKGDIQGHAKHVKPTRALSLFDEEILLQLREERYPLVAGSIGENITLRNVGVQRMSPGTQLQMGEVLIRLEEPRKPCFLLDAIDEHLKQDILGRCGYMASVLQGGTITPGTLVRQTRQNAVTA